MPSFWQSIVANKVLVGTGSRETVGMKFAFADTSEGEVPMPGIGTDRDHYSLRPQEIFDTSCGRDA